MNNLRIKNFLKVSKLNVVSGEESYLEVKNKELP
jgi:hypothetical protein